MARSLIEDIKVELLKYNNSHDEARRLYESVGTELFELAKSSPYLSFVKQGLVLQLLINLNNGGSLLFVRLRQDVVTINETAVTDIEEAKACIRDQVVTWCAMYDIRDIERKPVKV